MNFEFNDLKSRSNREKHDIDFIDAQQLWNDPNILEVEAKTSDEKRFLVIGKIMEKYWSGIITYRNSNIRIISVRRSRKKEIELYES